MGSTKKPDQNHCTIDFETRSSTSLPDAGTYKYAKGQDTDILCMAFNLTGDSLNTELWTPLDAFDECLTDLEPLFEHIKNGGIVEAHKSYFEFCIWSYVAVKKYDWPGLKLSQLRCSMAKARYNGLPGSLDRAGEALNLDIQKDKRGKQLIKLLCMPQKPTKKQPNVWINDAGLLRELFDYCVQDVNTEIELSNAISSMPDEEIAVWLLDQAMNHRGVCIDHESVNNILEVMGEIKADLVDRLPVLTNGQVTAPTQVARMKGWCESEGVPMVGLSADAVAATLKKDVPDKVKEVLEIRQVAGKTSTAKYQAMADKLCDDKRVRESLVYHAAHTGRWSGAGIQPQNLPRPTMKVNRAELLKTLNTKDAGLISLEYGNPFEAAANAIRNVIMAGENKVFLSADYNAIEARVLLWLADDQKALNVFRRGECLYCDMAASIYPHSAKEIYQGYKAGDFEFDLMRKFGKDTELGCGYQMGPSKFYDTLVDKGYEVTQDQAETIVAAYREKHSKVVELWGGLNTAAMEAIRMPSLVLKVPEALNRVAFLYNEESRILRCKLPSGRVLSYRNCGLQEKTMPWGAVNLSICYDSHTKQGTKRTHTYGGMLCENIVQATARDIMRDAMLRLDAAGYPLVLTVHDELLAELELDKQELDELETGKTLDEFCALMAKVPSWANGLPLAVEGWQGKRYRK